MAKQRRPSRRPRKTQAGRTARPRTSRPARRRTAPPAGPVAGTKQPKYLEAVGFYERGLEALRQRDFRRAVAAFETVLDAYPDERELHDRARLYLKVCERETSPPSLPQTSEELVYAATVALNAGVHGDAIRHLQKAIEQSPGDDRAHYMLAVAYAQQADVTPALVHLRRAVDLDPENRLLARQEPDFESLRGGETFRQILEPPLAHPLRRRPRRPPRQ